MGRARFGVRDEIKETSDAFYRALSNRNLKAIVSIWAHEPYTVVAGPSGGLHQGWPQVCHFWEQRFAELADRKVTAKLVNSMCHAVGDVGWLSGVERRTIMEDGETWSEELRVTCVLERKGVNWQLVSYHASLPDREADTEQLAS